jgi:hypothetical protein
MPEIKSVVVITANPVGEGDPGQCAEGWYVVENGMLTMVNRDGVPLRDNNTGRRFAMGLLPGESEKAAAKKLTLKVHRAARGDDMAGFHRPIRYGKSGLA